DPRRTADASESRHRPCDDEIEDCGRHDAITAQPKRIVYGLWCGTGTPACAAQTRVSVPHRDGTRVAFLALAFPTHMESIVIRGAREHNLKNIDVVVPRNNLLVITGVSGSGKSSLAFDTIFAEGQRRYVESLSAYARQFLE